MSIEEKFFKIFGIEPKIVERAVGKGFYIEHYTEEVYPQITDRILLELICIYNSECFWEDDVYIVPRDINKLKEYTLIHLINYKEYTFKHQWENIIKQVRSLFEGVEE